MINTRDVFPYAALTGPTSSRIVYLSWERLPEGTLEQIQELAIPEGLPRLRAHLERFRPLLLGRVRRWRERRPWWVPHRPRPEIVLHDTQEGWADFAVSTRWGAGNRLVVGLAKSGSLPASGLNAILPVTPATAPYIVALFNSSPVQDLAETLPPGELRQADFLGLGLPLIGSEILPIGERGIDLADRVERLVVDLAARWPGLPASLLEDISLGLPSTDEWIPEVGPSTSWGPLSGIEWVTSVETAGSQGQRIREIVIEHDLFGASVVVLGRAGARLRVRLHIEEKGILTALASYLRALASNRGTLADAGGIWVPTDAQSLGLTRNQDLEALSGELDGYRQVRQEVDDLVATIL